MVDNRFDLIDSNVATIIQDLRNQLDERDRIICELESEKNGQKLPNF
jgi:hypothetical protein